MPTFAEALEALGKVEGGDALVEAVRGEVSKKNREAENLRSRGKTLESKVRALAGADDSEDVEAVLGKLEHGLKAGSSSNDDRIKKLEQSLEAERKARETSESRRRETLVHAKIKDALVQHKAALPDDLLPLFVSKVKVGENEKLTILSESGEEVDVQAGIGSWLQARPQLVLSTQQPGPGGSGTKNGTPGVKSIPRAEYDRAVRERDQAVLDDIGAGKITISD